MADGEAETPATAPLFDSYLLVDWSAAAQPCRGENSIWLHRLDRSTGRTRAENPPTRWEARDRLRHWLEAELDRGNRVLLGFDFPFGYAAGFAARLGLGAPPWRQVWRYLAEHLVDGPDNANDRFRLAAAINERAFGEAAPFWGCPRGRSWPFLAPTHHRRHDALGLAERRLTDRRLTTPQPVWKLYGNGSAGGQALTGLPVVEFLRARFDGAALAWPFETGLAPPTRQGGRIVVAEIYPSLLKPVPRPGEVKDAAQLRTLAAHFAALDAGGRLAALFAGDPSLSPAERRQVEAEEGWILGAVLAKPRR